MTKVHVAAVHEADPRAPKAKSEKGADPFMIVVLTLPNVYVEREDEGDSTHNTLPPMP